MVDTIRRTEVEQDLFRLLDELEDPRKLSRSEQHVVEFSTVEREEAIRRIDALGDLDLIVPLGRPVRRKASARAQADPCGC